MSTNALRASRYSALLPLAVSICILVQPAHALSELNSSWFLKEQYQKSKLPQNDSLLAPLPEISVTSEIKITPPAESDLVAIGSRKLNPLKLEATISRSISLEDILEQALEKNLAIKISQDSTKSNLYLYGGALGRFLPDLSMTYKVQDIYQRGDLTSQIKTRNMSLNYSFFQGGKVYYDTRAKYFDYKASTYSLGATKNDILLDVFKKYNNILYNQILLHIRVKSLESSRAALNVNQQQLDAGIGTKYSVMQSKTQVAQDAQALVAQEVALRKAKIDLAAVLNESLFEDFVPEQVVVSKKHLLDPRIDVNHSISLALNNRPELKQYDYLRKSAQAVASRSASALMPVAQIYLSPNNTHLYSPSSSTSTTSSSTTTGSAGSVNLSTTGAGTTSVGLGNAVGSSLSFGGTVSWNLSGLGVPDSFTVLSNRTLAHRALQQYNQQVLTILQELRKSYVDVQTAEQQIEINNEGVEAARESLRLAFIRLKIGNGTNLEYIQSQKSYVDSLTNQAKAYIDYQNAQAQLLRDLGIISSESLVYGWK